MEKRSLAAPVWSKADMPVKKKTQRQSSPNLLHSSIVEGSKPDGRRQEMERNHHLSILFEGSFKPLEQTDGLVLQGVHIWSVVLFLGSGSGLGFLLWRLWFWQVWSFVEGWGRHPSLAGGARRRRPQVEGTTTGSCCWRLEESSSHQIWTYCCHPPQRLMS